MLVRVHLKRIVEESGAITVEIPDMEYPFDYLEARLSELEESKLVQWVDGEKRGVTIEDYEIYPPKVLKVLHTTITLE